MIGSTSGGSAPSLATSKCIWSMRVRAVAKVIVLSPLRKKVGVVGGSGEGGSWGGVEGRSVGEVDSQVGVVL